MCDTGAESARMGQLYPQYRGLRLLDSIRAEFEISLPWIWDTLIGSRDSGKLKNALDQRVWIGKGKRLRGGREAVRWDCWIWQAVV